MPNRSPVVPAKHETWLMAAKVAELRLHGFTCRAIGDHVDLSHERVSQLAPWGAALLIKYAEGVRDA